jgi:hypothetical protein
MGIYIGLIVYGMETTWDGKAVIERVDYHVNGIGLEL